MVLLKTAMATVWASFVRIWATFHCNTWSHCHLLRPLGSSSCETGLRQNFAVSFLLIAFRWNRCLNMTTTTMTMLLLLFGHQMNKRKCVFRVSNVVGKNTKDKILATRLLQFLNFKAQICAPVSTGVWAGPNLKNLKQMFGNFNFQLSKSLVS